MTVTQQGLLTLLKSAVTGERLELPEGFRLEDADQIIRSQSLLPLAYQGAFQCGISRESELMRQYETEYFKILLHSERQMRAVRQISRAFEVNQIDYMPLKGCNLKQLYLQPELRMMGDTDILIRLEQYEKIKPVLSSLGFQEEKENGHEITWRHRGLNLELHKCLFAPDEKDLFPYFGDGWSRAVPQKNYRYSLRAEDEFIFLFTHMTKHYRGSGIGSRHFLDLYVFRRAHPEMNEQKIKAAMKSLRLLEFYENVCNLLDVWFEDGEPDEKTEHITQWVFSAGSWGKLENLTYSHQLKLQKNRDAICSSKARELLEAVFPSVERMQYRYKMLQKRPYLLPVFWPVRWLHLAFTSRDTVRTKLKMIRYADDDKIEAHRRALNFVGLDFYNE